MARNNKIQMPSGGGGLIRYFDDYKSKIEFKPGHVLVLIALVAILIILLHAYGNAWLGIPQ